MKFSLSVCYFKSKISLKCYICVKEIEEEEEASVHYTECDSCDRNFHYKCAGLNKKEKDARNSSKCRRLFCQVCMDESEGTIERMKEITKLLYKLDLFNQQQIVAKQAENDAIAAISAQLQALETKVSKLETGNANQTKKKQHSKKTYEEIVTNVNIAKVDVCGSRNVSGGGIVLRCNNTADTMKVKQLVSDKLGDNYEVLLPKIKLPRLRITNINVRMN